MRKSPLYLIGFLLAAMPLFGQPFDHKQLIPHFSQTPNLWHTQIVIYNPASTTSTLYLKAYDNQGDLVGEVLRMLEPYGQWVGNPQDLLNGLTETSGWFEVHSKPNKVSGVVSFKSLFGGDSTSIPLISRLENGLLFPGISKTIAQNKALVLVNPNPTAQEISFNLIGPNRTFEKTVTHVLSPNARFVGLIENLFGNDFPLDSHLEISAAKPIAGFVLNFSKDHRHLQAFTGQEWDPGFLPVLRSMQLSWFQQAQIKAGLILAVDHPQLGLAAAANGWASLEEERPMYPDTISEVGSVSKTFIAALILLLQEDGKLSIDDKLSNYLEYPNADRIPLRWLLNHHAGTPNYTELPSWRTALERSLENGTPAWTPHQILAETTNYPFEFEPGEAFHYSNTNYLILAMIAESVGEKPLGAQLRERIWQPQGMTRTFMAHSEQVPKRAISYFYNPNQGNLQNLSQLDPNWLWGTSIVSTAQDLARWVRALFSGNVLQPSSLQDMLSPGDQNTENPSYGLGMSIHDQGENIFYSHSGQTLGATAQLFYFPKKDLGLTLLFNTSHQDIAYSQYFQQLLKMLEL